MEVAGFLQCITHKLELCDIATLLSSVDHWQMTRQLDKTAGLRFLAHYELLEHVLSEHRTVA